MVKKDNAWKRLMHKMRIPYRLVIMNDSTFEEKFSLKLSRLNVFVVFSLLSLVLVTLTVFIIAFTPLREYIPGYGSVGDREMMYKLSLKSDSLEQELSAREMYFNNFFNVLSNSDSALLSSNYENYTKGTGTALTENSDATGLYYTSPVDGTIINHYNAAGKHYAVDFSAQKGAVIKSVADGIVLFSDWTLAGGNTVIILHPSKVVSVYMHNLSLFVQQGETVRSGDPVAIIGNSGEKTTGPHLHFELWINMQPVNPENYILF